jgi:hypothetical protein
VAALASSSDVEASLGRSLTSTEEERVERLLAGASLLARDISRRPFEAGDYTVTRLVRGDRVHLPEVATVTEVRAVDADGTATVLSDYTHRGKTIYGLAGYRDVEVDYTVASDYEVPDDVVGAVADMVAAVFTAPAPADVASQAAGPFAVTYRTSAGTLVADGVVLRTLKRYGAKPRAAVNLL